MVYRIKKYQISFFLLLILLVLLFYFVSETDSFIGPRISVLYILMGIFLSLSGFLHFYNSKKKILTNYSLNIGPTLVFYLLFIIYTSFSYIWSRCKPCTVNEISFIFLLSLFIYFFDNTLKLERIDIDKSILLIYSIGVGIGIYSIFQYFGMDFLNLTVREGKFRVSALYGNPNFLSNFLIIPFFIGISRIILSYKEKLSIIFLNILSFFPIFLVIILARSLSVWISLFFGLLYGVSIYRLKKPIYMVILFFILILVLSMPYIFFDIYLFHTSSVSYHYEKISIPFFKTPDFIGRVMFFHQGLLMLKDSNFLGMGPGSLFRLLPIYKAKFFLSDPSYKNIFPTSPFPYHLHNEYVEFLAEYGIIGFLLLFIIFSYFLYKVSEGLVGTEDKRKKIVIVLFISAIFSFSIDCLSSFPLHLPANLFLFLTTIVILKNLAFDKSSSHHIHTINKKYYHILLPIFGILLFIIGIFYVHRGISLYLANAYYSKGAYIIELMDKKGIRDLSLLKKAKDSMDKFLKTYPYYPRRDVYPNLLKTYLLLEKDTKRLESLIDNILSFTYTPSVLRGASLFYFSNKRYKEAIPYIEDYLKETYVEPDKYFDIWTKRLIICYNKTNISYSDFLKKLIRDR